MPTARPFAYNPGAPISGTTQYGTLAVGVSPELDYPSGAGGVRWWNGPDEDLGYCIGTSVPAGDQPTPEGNNGTVQFWRTSGFSDNEFITLASTITGQNFTGGTEAQTWLNSNGYWTSFENPLLVYLDSGNPSSYNGTGSTWFDLEGESNNATLINSPTYSPSYQGILQFDDASLEYATIPNIGDLPYWTVETWFRLSTALTGKVSSILSNQFDLVNKLNYSVGTNNAPANSNLAVGFFDGAWHSTNGFVPQVGVWYQVVGTYDGSVIRQYVNGVASGGTLNYVGNPQSGGEVRLMRRWDSSLSQGNMVDGDLAIVKIYNIALNASEVLSNYNSTFSRFIEPTPTPTSTNTPTPTNTLTPTLTQTPTITTTPTPTQTPTNSVTPTLTQTPTNSNTPTLTQTPTTSLTPSITPTLTQTPTRSITPATYLTIGGGGGGGSNWGGGGGAGQFVSGTTDLVGGTTYNITLGNGGNGATGTGQGANGGTTTFSGTGLSISAIGGGGGGYNVSPTTGTNGSNGASGGGGGGGGGARSTGGTGLFGFNGGSVTIDNSGSGGGGGSTQSGANGTSPSGLGTGGNGGNGTTSNITGSAVVYAGGGGGGGDTGSVAATGGTGGGGNGGNTNSGAGSNATGYGSGGGGGATNGGNGGNGSQGVVILSVPTAKLGSYTGSPTVTTNGSNTVLTFINNGSYTAI